MTSKKWGYHYIANLGGCELSSMQSKKNIKLFLTDILETTDMTAFGPPIFKYVKPTPETLKKEIDGYSVVQVIITSSITLHFVDSKQLLFFDFFSCKQFNKTKVKELLKKYFGFSMIEEHFLTRNALTN